MGHWSERLVDTQFPQWAGLPLKPLNPAGSDHVIYRLGKELSVRLPRHAGAVGQARKEFQWLPRLAPHLPLAVPVPVGVGDPDFGYPWSWAVSRWLDGEVATVEALSDSSRAAMELAHFLSDLQRFAPEDVCREHPGRPHRLAVVRPGPRDAARHRRGRWHVRRRGDDRTVGRGAERPGWDRPPVWFHGDFHTGNLLTVDGRLSAVIDFGGLGTGDPACDLMIAFTLMTADSRAVFRGALGVDDATWMRGRGWALATGLNAYTAYAAVNPSSRRANQPADHPGPHRLAMPAP